MKICYHDNGLSVRGTSNALWDYAEKSQKFLGVEPIILYNHNSIHNQEIAIKRFESKFKTYSYQNLHQIDDILSFEKCDAFFMIKGGKPDGVISKYCENWINAISICGTNDVHGEKFAMGSKWLSKITDYKIDYVSYMIDLPEHDEDFRKELNIPEEAIVFGRNGGHDSFDLDFAKKAVVDILDKRKNVYFLFQGTDKFFEHERIIHIPATPDLEIKVKFINTCDALIHARNIGESFGLTCAEFSMKNKPVITWFDSRERNHIEYLGENGLFYRNYQDLLDILLRFEPDESKDWRCYQDCLPEIVMEKFKKIYMK
jgi:hypothetical protein